MNIQFKDIKNHFHKTHEITVKDVLIVVDVKINQIKDNLELSIVAKRQTTLGLLSQASVDFSTQRSLNKGKAITQQLIDTQIEVTQSEKFINGMKSFLTAHYEARLS